MPEFLGFNTEIERYTKFSGETGKTSWLGKVSIQNDLWTKANETDFFMKSLKIAAPDQLFYSTKDGAFVAYWPKNYKGPKTTLQSRNAFIGAYTEKLSQELLSKIAKELDAHAVRKVVCKEFELSKRSPADVAICKTDSVQQKPEDIIAIFEVKMSVVWNWQLLKNNSRFSMKCLGDYKTHEGNPGLLRSDTMLKAIGKSISVRISTLQSAKIPIIVLGNTPITDAYYTKVDNLKKYGIIQGFWSVNPEPLDNEGENIKTTPGSGFLRFDSFSEFRKHILDLLTEDREFFTGMKAKKDLGKLIEIANRENTYEKKAEKFLALIRGDGGNDG